MLAPDVAADLHRRRCRFQFKMAPPGFIADSISIALLNQ